MVVSLLAFAVVGIGLICSGARLGRRAFLLAAVPVTATTVWVAAQVGDVTGGRPVTERARVVELARARGITPGSPADLQLAEWLAVKPG